MSKVTQNDPISNRHDERGDDPATGALPLRATGAAPRPEKPNPFDPARLRVATDYTSALGLVKQPTTIPVRKPNDQMFVRSNPDEDRRVVAHAIHLKDEREGIYLVAPEIAPEIPDLVTPTQFVESVTRQGLTFLWFVKLAGVNGRTGDWTHSALAAIEAAERNWVKVKWNGASYDVYIAPGITEEPSWTTMPFDKVLELAFRTRYVDTLDHPVIKALRGEE